MIVATTDYSLYNVTIEKRPLRLREWRRISIGNTSSIVESTPISSLSELGDLKVDIHFLDNST